MSGGSAPEWVKTGTELLLECVYAATLPDSEDLRIGGTGNSRGLERTVQ